MGGYRELFNSSINDPARFWAHAAQAVSWIREPRRILDDTNPPFYRWFPDAELNTCANALDRHVEAWPSRPGRADLRLTRDRDPQRTLHLRQLLRRHFPFRRCVEMNWAWAKVIAWSSTCR